MAAGSSSTSIPSARWQWAARRHDDEEIRDDLDQNLADIKEAARVASRRIVAFGAEPLRRDPAHRAECLKAFEHAPMLAPTSFGANRQLYCLGVSGCGSPLHPMARGRWRVPDAAQPRLWTAVA
jgi:hypothetical protein